MTIFRLDLMSKTTMAKPQEQVVSGETVLVRDGEPFSSTMVYLDEGSMSAYSATSTIDTNHYQQPMANDLNGSPSDLGGLREAKKEEADQKDTNSETGDHPNQVHDHQEDQNKSGPLLNSTTATPIPTIGRQWSRDEWLAKEYFSYLCGTFDFGSFDFVSFLV